MNRTESGYASAHQQFGGKAIAWANEENAHGAPDASGAIAFATEAGDSNDLALYGFGFTIPDWATLTVLTYGLTKKQMAGSTVSDLRVQPCVGAVLKGDNEAKAGTWPESFTEFEYGGSDDWGLEAAGVTPANLRDQTTSGFGMANACTMAIDSGAYIDAANCQITYSLGKLLSRSCAERSATKRYSGGI